MYVFYNNSCVLSIYKCESIEFIYQTFLDASSESATAVPYFAHKCTLWTTPMLYTIQEAIRLAGVDIRRLRLIECASSFGLRLRVAIHINLNPLGLDWDSYVYSMLRIAHDALDLDGHSNTIRLSPCRSTNHLPYRQKALSFWSWLLVLAYHVRCT